MNNNFSIGARFADLAYGEDKNRIRRSLNSPAPNSTGASGNLSGAGITGGVRADARAAGWGNAAEAGPNIPDRQDSAAVAARPADDVSGAVPSAAALRTAAGGASSPSGVPSAAAYTAAKADQAAENSAAVPEAGTTLDFSNKNLINSVILSEVLGKPKFFRKGRW
jgi:hypothetical protein